eukprot:8180474-Pyramimonas_sp.AAC.1
MSPAGLCVLPRSPDACKRHAHSKRRGPPARMDLHPHAVRVHGEHGIRVLSDRPVFRIRLCRADAP